MPADRISTGQHNLEGVMRSTFFWTSILSLALVTLCAAGPPVKDPQITQSKLPGKCSIENVPIYRQPYMDCGPTSLRMILNFYGQNLSQEEVGKARKGRGTNVSDLESYARGLKFEVYSFYDSKKQEMKYLLAQGYPLIALGVCPPTWPKGGRYSAEGHFVVVAGYDDEKNIFHVHDPNGGRKLEVPYDVFKDFHRSHPTHGNYVFCIYPKPK